MLRKTILNGLLGFSLLAGAQLSNAALLGLTPNEPTVDFSGSGVITYNAATGLVTISGDPLTLFQTDPFIFGEILPTGADNEKLVTIKFYVNPSTGEFVQGVAGGPDLVIEGEVDSDFDGVVDYQGALLTAEVTQFGFQDGGAGDDRFDLRFNTVGGGFAPLYVGNDIALTIASEISAEFPNAFVNTFTSSFTSQAKGTFGSVAPLVNLACHVTVDASCSVKGSANKDKCRIDASKSKKYWDEYTKDYNGHSCGRSKYGNHGTYPAWWNSPKYKTTDVKFTYVITNTGTTPITNLLLDDSFDAVATGVPTTLAPGASATIIRTEKLSEALTNIVAVSGKNGTADCGDTDNVVIKNKLKDRKKQDDDDYKDKGRHDRDDDRDHH